jgi:hypothetical protein
MNEPITVVIGHAIQGMTKPFFRKAGFFDYDVKGAYAGLDSLCCEWGENIELRTSNIERRSEEKRSLAEAVWIFGSRQISRQSVARESVGYRDIVSRFGGDSGRKWGIATEIRTMGLQAIPEETRATHKDTLSVKIKSKRG